MNRVPWRQLWRRPGQSAPQRFLMLVHYHSDDVAKSQPSRGGGENRPQYRGRGDSLCDGPNHQPQHRPGRAGYPAELPGLKVEQPSLVWVVRYALNKFSLGTAMLGCRQLVPVVSRWTQNTRFIMQQRRVEKIKNGLIQTV